MVPRRRRMVSSSSSDWVGFSWLPSPPLMTAQFIFSARSCTAPESGWRTTSTSGCMAFSVIAVSIRVSPFLLDDQAPDMLITSALSLFAASPADVLVRGALSEQRLQTVDRESVGGGERV